MSCPSLWSEHDRGTKAPFRSNTAEVLPNHPERLGCDRTVLDHILKETAADCVDLIEGAGQGTCSASRRLEAGRTQDLAGNCLEPLSVRPKNLSHASG
jgi:hypothetical protein